MFSNLNTNIKIRLFLHFVEKFIEGAVTPFFIIYLSQKLGTSLAGSLLLIAMIVAGFSSLVGGHISDLYGRRNILVPTELTKAIALILFAGLLALEINTSIATYTTFLLYFLVLLCNGIGVPVSEALVLDIAPQHELRRIYAYLYWITNVARSVGTIIGVILYEMDFAFLAIITAILAIIGAAFTKLFLQETIHSKFSHHAYLASIIKDYIIVFKDKIMLMYVMASTLNFGIAVQLSYYIAVRLAQEFPEQTLSIFGNWTFVVTGITMFGILRLETNLIAVIFANLVQRWTQNINPRVLFLLGPLAATTGFVLLMVSNNIEVLIFAMALYTAGELFYAPAKMALIGRIAPPEARSRYAAVRSFDFRLAMMIGAGSIAILDFVTPWTMAVLVATMGFFVIVLLNSVERRLNTSQKIKLKTELAQD